MTDIDGCRFADLYAGSGAVGLEAASRGAAHVLLVESRPEGGPGDPGEHRGARAGPGVPAGRPAGWPPCWPAAAGRRRTTWSSPIRRTPARRGDSPRCWPRWSARLAGPGRGARRRAVHPVRAEPGAGWKASQPSVLAATVRRCFGTVAARERRAGRRGDEASGVPRLVRPGHQRAPGHHRPGQPALRRGDRRGAGQPVQEGLFTIDERIDMLREVTKPYDNVRVESFHGLLVDFCRAQRRERWWSRACGRSATSTTSCRWPR